MYHLNFFTSTMLTAAFIFLYSLINMFRISVHVNRIGGNHILENWWYTVQEK